MAREPFTRTWAEVPVQFEEPPTDIWQDGWKGGPAEDPPEAKWQNWWQNRADVGLQQIERQGVMDYEATAIYEIGGRAIGSDGIRYRSVSDGNTGNDPTADDGANWEEDPDLVFSTPAQTKEGELQGVAVSPHSLLNGMIGSGNLASKGHIKIPVNIAGVRVEFIVQWAFSSGGSPDQTYDIQFPNAVFNVQVTDSGSSSAYGVNNVTQIGFSIISDHPNDTYQWLAIGY